MKLPETHKSFANLLIQIAVKGNDYNSNLTHEEQREFGYIIADIQNWLGEHEELLSKLKLNHKWFINQ